MPFSEQTVSVVIGAASSLGRAVEQALSERPGKVVAKYGSQLDVADEWAVGSFFEALGTIDHVIVTGGLAAGDHRSAALDFAAARATFDLEFWGALAIAKEAARYVRPGGSITLTSTSAAHRSAVDGLVGPATDAALGIATKVLARELAPLRVNLVEAAIHCCLFAIDNPWLTGAVLPLRPGGDRLQLQTQVPQKTLGVASPEVT